MPNRRILMAFTAFLAVLACGALGFVVVEGYTWPEGFYMAVITVTTVGFGEIRPLTPTGRGFTTVYTLLSFLSVAVLLHSVVGSMLNSVLSRGREGIRMKKAISAMKSPYILCGYGRMGQTAARQFQKAGHDFAVIELDPGHCETLRKEDIVFVEGDATQESVLLEAGIKRARGLLAMLGSDPCNLYITLTARELNPTLHIIARAEEEASGHRMLKAGADEVVSPFATAGRHVAKSLLQATGDAATPSGPTPREDAPPRKVVLVDDDPVVMRLYSKLLKRAGYLPLQATNAESGLDLIENAGPLAAVVGDTLPTLPGVELCRRVRKSAKCAGVKLVLFTADGRSEHRDRGLAEGADEVVVKGVQAFHVIETLDRLLDVGAGTGMAERPEGSVTAAP